MYTSTEVRHCSADGSVVLMNLRSGEYSILNKPASAMWSLLLMEKSDRQRGIASLAAESSASISSVEADLYEFGEGCLKQGLLLENPPAAAPRANRKTGIKPPLRIAALHAWLVLLKTAVLLRREGFGGTYRRYAGIEKIAEERSGPELQLAIQRFRMAENFFIFPNAPKDCLPRSLALYRFLIEMGLPASHCIGVQRFPFTAHAWVECNGSALFNNPEDIARYNRLAQI